MSAVAEKRKNILAVLFATGVDVEDYSNVKFDKEQQKALDNTDKRAEEVEKGFNFTTNSSKNGGFAKKIDPKTEQAMRKMHEQVKQKSVDDKELEL